jgi:hypothetical protein
MIPISTLSTLSTVCGGVTLLLITKDDSKMTVNTEESEK